MFYLNGNYQPFEIYYYILFFLIYIVKLIKDYVIADRNGIEFNFLDSFNISFDITIASVGAVIIKILTIKSINGISIILTLVIVFILLSFFAEIIKTYTVKFCLNLLIILIILFSFHNLFDNINKSKILNSNDSKELIPTTYKIFIPYDDISLINNIGYKKFGNKKMVYIDEIKGIDEEEVRKKAIINFYNKIKPIYKTEDTSNIEIFKDDIHIIKL
jgi:hypothetical protein